MSCGSSQTSRVVGSSAYDIKCTTNRIRPGCYGTTCSEASPRSAGLSKYHRRAIEWFGAERCMFGSDWPVCLLAAEYGDVLELLRQAISGVGERERADILGGTAERTYGL